MSALRHEMIFASAGSGKTYALTTRFLRLLALGVAPERIVALTFTRKAAGEFFGEILTRLAGACAADGAAHRLAADVGRPELGRGEFLRLLRGMVDSMHRLHLGTLDGFFAQLVRAFPLELGLGGEPGLIDEFTAAEEMRRVLARLFAAGGELTEEQRSLVEAFKLATFGAEGKSVAESFDRFVGEYLALYRNTPELARWGTAARIWPSGFPWAVKNDGAAEAGAAEVLIGWAERAELSEKHRERFAEFSRAALGWTPGQPWGREIAYVAEKVLADWETFARRGGAGAKLKFDRTVIELPPEATEATAALVRRLVGLELGRRMAETQGLAAVMRLFDASYDAAVRRAGRLTFADLQQLLRRGDALAGTGLTYRIDAQLDHWLFDEFQDTSYGQWKILEPFVDEVVQDPEGRRSLFYVGDVKQAIYTWREGDPRLFAHVAERYRAGAGGGVVVGELNDSWRSGPEVIEMVNRVCGDCVVMKELFPEAAEEWNRHWREHRSARPEHAGQAALLAAEDEAGRWETTLRVLREIRPTERGLTCAVLVRRNEIGARLADYLRREGGIAAVAEADLRIGTDNPVATALAALLQLAAHPADEMARRTVAMSPLAALLEPLGLAEEAVLSRAVLSVVAADGFESWLAGWASRLEPVLAEADVFTRLRLRQLVAAGRAFDERGSREVDAFLRFLAEYRVREPEGAGVVRVMTVHKSKGLGFDVVILPDLEGQKLAQRRDGPAVGKAADRSVSWILQHPGATIAEADPVLRENQAQAVGENCYEQLALLYVALTRAKRATYVVVERPGKSKSLNFPRLMLETLGAEECRVKVGGAEFDGWWGRGSADWFAGRSVNAAGAAAARPGEVVVGESATAQFGAVSEAVVQRVGLVAIRPSGLSPERVQAGRLFAEGRAELSARFGTQVHALLAAVAWCDGGEPARMRELAGRANEQAWDDALCEAEACVRAPALAVVFCRNNDADEVWCERGFEAVVDGAWVSGVLDRVVIRRSAAGVEADIFDFKTERGASIDGVLERYAPQLRVYGTVVRRLLAVPEARIRGFLVLTECQQLVPLELSS